MKLFEVSRALKETQASWLKEANEKAGGRAYRATICLRSCADDLQSHIGGIEALEARHMDLVAAARKVIAAYAGHYGDELPPSMRPLREAIKDEPYPK